jgi:hypothetical protein
MNFQQALNALISRDKNEIDEARTVVTRAVADALDISYSSDEAASLGDWIAAGEFGGSETAESIAAEWQAAPHWADEPGNDAGRWVTC